MGAIEQYPHCDAAVLHAKGECDYCDLHPEWQELRETWGINFTGKNDPAKQPCPSERNRPAHVVHRWHGNRPTNVPVDLEPPEVPTALERVLRDDEV